MSSDGFDNAAEDFTDLKKAIESLIRVKLPKAQKESRKLVLKDINQRLDAGQVLLNDMQREVDRATVGVRPQLSYRMRSYHSEFNGLKRELEQAERNQQLGFNQDYNKPDSTRRQVLSNQGAIERSSAAVERTERLAVETETIGNEITNELGQQRDQLVRTRDMLDQTDSTLNKSRRTILNMGRKAMTNKVALVSIIVVEVVILGGVLYWKFR